MLSDSQYLNTPFRLSEIDHLYGNNFHILSDPYLNTVLGTLGRPTSKQPLVNQLLHTLYREMVKAVANSELPLANTKIETRMKAHHPEGEFLSQVIDPNTRLVSVNLARAGTVPSQICFDAFNYILNPDGVRQDHISINRKTNTNDEVVGTDLGGVKIGGDIEGAYVVFPDPMGATGSTIDTAMEIYQEKVPGKAKAFIAIHLIVTPEYLKKVAQKWPDLIVYAIRLDRGLSSKEVLDTKPGEKWDQERGLNDKQYIVPGAGGLGEVINNSYV